MRVAVAGLPRFPAAVLAALIAIPASAAAETKVSATAAANAKLHVRVGPGRGAGERRVESADPARASEAPSTEERAREATPEGSDEPELRTLRDAERQLFPEPRTRPYTELDGDIPLVIERPGPALNLTGLQPPPGAARAKPAGNVAWPRDLVPPDLPCSYEQRTLDYIKFYRDTLRGRAITEIWARRAGRYAALIQAELVRAGLPSDLLWLSLVESGHNSNSRSRAGAVGLWQFIPESARLYGLNVDRWVDERLDPLRSTQAAVVYLAELWRRFGSWELAMAAYNMGQAGLTRSIRKYNSNDFWRLSRLEAGLPWETALYVPKVLATAIVMKNRRAFGFADVQPDAPLAFDTVYVAAGVPLGRIAQHAGVAESLITSLNPQYLKARTPPPSAGEAPRLWPVYVPEGQGASVIRRLAQAPSGEGGKGGKEGLTGEEYASVRVRMGDSPASLALRLRGSEAELRAWNRLEPNERLCSGCNLIVPRTWLLDEQGQPLPLLEDTESVVVLPPFRFHFADRERLFYRTLPGDDLDSLASALTVRPDDLVIWNALDPKANLQADMVLQVFVPNGTAQDSVRLVSEGNAAEQLEVGSPSFLAHFEAEQGRQRLQIQAREGDTLQSIGKRYELSPGTMERINHFARDRRLSEGAAIVVYAKEGTTATEVLWSRAPDPLPPVAPPYPAALPGGALR
ncbi:MAG: transglycosylase SLT domain-containing protein [Deltaproteobacteria bacterium]